MKSSDYWFRKIKIDITVGILATLLILSLVFLILLIFNISLINMGGFIGGAIMGGMVPALLDAYKSYKNGKEARELEQGLTDNEEDTRL